MLPTELKEWRKKLGLTQEEAGRRLGVSRVAEQNWEKGTTPIPKAVEAASETIVRELMQRPDFGPVILVYRDASMPRGSHSLAMMQSESFPNNETALRRACVLSNDTDFQGAFIHDGKGNTIWNIPRLRAEIERRLVVKESQPGKPGLAERLMEIGRHFSSLPAYDDRSPDEIIGYDEKGLPR